MFRKEINFISDLNLNKLQDLGDRFTIEDIKSINIHPALIQYIDSAIENEILDDRKKIESNSMFNYGTDRINDYFNLISEEIKRIQIFSHSYIRQLVQKAIIFNVNYLTRPNRTLTKLIFDEEEIKSIEEIVVGVSHAYYYQYIKKIIFTYLEKKKILIMSRDEFYTLLLKIDSISRQTHLEDTLETAVNSMANFFDQDTKSSEKIPLEAIKIYLKERQLEEFESKIDEQFNDQKSVIVPAGNLIQLFRSVIPETEIELESAKYFEEELEVDNTEDKGTINDTTAAVSEQSDNSNDNPDDNEIFEVHDEVDIPNHELLTDDSISEPAEISEIEDKPDESDFEEYSEEEIEQNTKDNDKSADEKRENEKAAPQEEELKKKPDSAPLLRKLFDINSIYAALLSQPKPFEDFIDYKEMFIQDDHLKNETDFKLDHSTLSESIEIGKTEIQSEETVDKDESIRDDKDIFDDKVEIAEDVKTEEKPEIIDKLKDDSDIESSIDNIVGDEKTEDEFIEENKSIETVDQDTIDAEELNESLLKEDAIVSNKSDEELTEVFTDLAFIDKIEEDLEIPPEIEDSEISAEEINEDEIEEPFNQKKKEHFSNFQEMTADRDMTKIIEFIFDYDMEDYHLTLNNISEADNEEEAFHYIDNYCKNNHIDIHSSEVNQFKTLISDYYEQAYS